jgi:hypothetical protein
VIQLAVNSFSNWVKSATAHLGLLCQEQKTTLRIVRIIDETTHIMKLSSTVETGKTVYILWLLLRTSGRR